MTPTERERIEDEAKSIYDKIMRFDDGNEMRAYIAGATAEHERYSNRASALLPQLFGEQLELERDKARNQAIQDCIEEVRKVSSQSELRPKILEALEQLKKRV